MTFLNPAALWAFLSLIPLLALYFFKVRPEKKSTTTLFLWNKIFEDKKQNGLFKNPRDLISLLMMILAMSAVIVAAAQPRLITEDSDSNLVIIIDNSASMSTVEGQQSRLQLAKQKASNIIKNLSSDQTAVLASASSQISILQNATNHHRSLLNTIENIQHSDLALNSRELQNLLKNSEKVAQSRIVFISDGCFKNAEKVKNLELIKIAKQSPNIGISAFDIQRTDKENCSLYFQLSSSYSSAVDTELHLAQGSKNNIVKIIPLTVQAGLNKAEVHTIADPRNGKWFLFIKHQDSMTIDNTARAYLKEPNPVKIKLDIAGTFFRHCIDSFEATGQLLKTVDSKPEISISSSGSATQHSKIIFAPQGESPYWKSLGEVIEVNEARLLVDDHPALRHCPADTLRFAGSRNITAPENSVILLVNEDKVPLIFKSSSVGSDAYIINMDPLQSELHLNVYFPILIYSLSKDLSKRPDQNKTVMQSGTTIALPKETSVTEPNGQSHSRSHLNLDQSGFYSWTQNDVKQTAAVSLLNQFESLNYNETLQEDIKEFKAGFPLNEALIIFALLLILSEFILYHRRKVG